MGVTPINSYSEFKEIISKDKPVLIDFWATWCGPCRIISPIFEKFSNTYEGVEFYKVDVDVQEQISQEVGVRAMPTFTLFSNGNKVGDVVGAIPQKLEALVKKAQEYLPQPKQEEEPSQAPDAAGEAKDLPAQPEVVTDTPKESE